MGWEHIEQMPFGAVQDELLALLQREQDYVFPARGPSYMAEEDDADADESRRSICQWNYECVDYFLYDREVVHFSMNYYDRYSAILTHGGRQPLSPVMSHLVALASLFLACKLHGELEQPHQQAQAAGGKGRPVLRLEDFTRMSHGQYCPQMLEEMEMAILTNLQWKVNPPAPMDFLMRYTKILSQILSIREDRVGGENQEENFGAPTPEDIDKGWSVFEVARYQTELAVYSHRLCSEYTPSEIALAAILNAMDSKIVNRQGIKGRRNSKRRTVISSPTREMFLNHVHWMGMGQVEEGGNVLEARKMLKQLCSATIVLPATVSTAADAAPAASLSSATNAVNEGTEYELPEINTFVHYVEENEGKFISSFGNSPVSVATKHF